MGSSLPLEEAVGRWRAPALRLVRFAVVGASSSLLYALIVFALLSWGIGPLPLVHCIAYALAIPYGYLAQRGFTFRSHASHVVAFPRFVATNAVSFAATSVFVVLADALRIHAAAVVLAVVVLVPLINYLCLNRWVFAQRPPAH